MIRVLGIAVIALSFGSVVTAEEKPPTTEDNATVQARQAIQKIYDSPLYRTGTAKHPASLHWPSSYKVDEKSFVWLRTIKKFSLQGDKATVVIEYHDSVFATDPKTKRVVRIEAIDTNEDVWSKEANEWLSDQSKLLTSDYLIDGKSPYFVPAKVPEKEAKE